MVNPDTHQWYRINNHEIRDSHTITICNDKTAHMVQLQPAESDEAKTIETFTRLSTTNSQLSIDQFTNRQPITSSHNKNENNTSFTRQPIQQYPVSAQHDGRGIKKIHQTSLQQYHQNDTRSQHHTRTNQ